MMKKKMMNAECGMMKQDIHHSSFPCGFTLIEILVAIFIFGIVVTTVFGSFSAVFHNTDAINESLTSYEMARTCLNRMMDDLSEIYVSMPPEYKPPDIDDKPNIYRFVGDFNNGFSRCRFTSRAHISFEDPPAEGIAEIVYYVHTIDEENILRRADTLHTFILSEEMEFEERQSDPALCENVKSLEFVYYDDDGEEHDKWDSESEDFKYATPRGIKIKLEIGDESSSVVFETTVGFPFYRGKIEK